MTFQEMYLRLAEELEDEHYKKWSLARLQEYLNEANAKLLYYLYDKTEWQVSSVTITTANGTQTYDLPADFKSMVRVWRDEQYQLEPDFQRQPGIMSTNIGEPLRYWIEGAYKITGAGPTTAYAQIGFYPIPDGVYSVLIEYLPTAATMSEDTDISPIPAMFHDLIILNAMIHAYLKKGKFDMVNGLRAQRNERMQEFMSFIGDRNAFQTPRLRDIFSGPQHYYERIN